MWSFRCGDLLCISVLPVLLLHIHGMPTDQNKVDNVIEYKIYDKVLYGEPVIFTEEEEFLEYAKDKSQQQKEKPLRKQAHVNGNQIDSKKEHKNKTRTKDYQQEFPPAGNHFKAHTCGPVTLPICRGLDLYPLAQFPNNLGHNNDKEARKSLEPYLQFMKDKKCGNFLKKFLCLMLSPQCTGTDEPLPPCRAVCRAAKDGCWKSLKHVGMTWPTEWKCDRFPKDGLCADLDSHITPVPEPLTKSKQRSHSLKISNQMTSGNKTHHSETASQQHTQEPITNSVSVSKVQPKKNLSNQPIIKSSPKLRRYDMAQLGHSDLFQGWADVQGQGAANDYCRVIGTNPRFYFLSCTLGGSTHPDHQYVSKRGFDVGHMNTWFMRDLDGDGRDDYCRCVGRGIKSVVSCMKAGDHGFYGSPRQSGNEYTFTVQTAGPCFQRKVNPFIGI